MGDYLSLAWRADDENRQVAGRLVAAARAAGYALADETETSWLGVAGPRAPPRHHLSARVTVLGDLFETPGATSFEAGDDDPATVAGDLDLCRRLTRARWGRYVALFRDVRGRVRKLFRDPSGTHEGLTWTFHGVQVVTSATPDWLVRLAPPAGGIRWATLAAQLSDPMAVLSSVALDGVRSTQAGDLDDLDAAGRSDPVWRPADFIGLGPREFEEARRGLRATLDACAQAWSTVPDAAVEVSGGLDSAIVAAALAETGTPVRMWLNTFTARPETDERVYARALADRWSLPLTEAERTLAVLDVGALAETAWGPRPGLNGADVGFDRLVADRCATVGASALMTGKGGDAVFFHGHTAAVFVDHWLDVGPLSLPSPLLVDIARWTRRSIWSVAVEAMRSNPSADPTFEDASHPWLLGLRDAGPAKRRQVAALTGTLAFGLPCRRSAVVDMIHPILSQPVVEWLLGVPVPVLVRGGRDRALARATFGDRLPEIIRERRTKGDYSAWFGRETAAGLDALRRDLRNGRLIEEGLIDVAELDALCEIDRLRWKGGSGRLISLANLEAWVRCWEDRIGRRAPEPPSSAGARGESASADP